jgi:glycerate-2-kinase
MDAMRGMAKKAESMGYEPFIIERPIIDYADKELEYIFSNCKKGRTVISGGEVKIKWPKGQVGRKGHGGRNQHLSLLSLDMVSDDQVFISYASDGIDNSDSAGAIGDAITRKKANDHKLDRKLFLENMNTHIFFEVTGDLIFTGPTKANVSDIQLLLCKK